MITDITTIEDGETTIYSLKGFGLTRCLAVVNNIVVRYFYRSHEYNYDHGNSTGLTNKESGNERDWLGPDRVMRDMIEQLKLETNLL